MSEAWAAPDPAALAREKARSRALRQSGWWKRRLGAGRCHYCGRHMGPTALTMDHVVPLARGGRAVRGNVVPACKTCNSQKKYLLPVEWQAYLDRLAEPSGD